MKFSLIFLAFYIGFLSCFPCQDAPGHVADDISTKNEVAQDIDQHDDEPGDYCSPFCSCSCCATVHISPAIPGYALAAPFLASPEKTFEYKASFDHDNAGLIWQPPRLV